MDLKLHYIYGNLLVAAFIVDQVKNILLQHFYSELGKEGAFQIWWIFYVIENWELRLVFNLVILITACRRLPEFIGYTGQPFPGKFKTMIQRMNHVNTLLGQPSPRNCEIEPRRTHQAPNSFNRRAATRRINYPKIRIFVLPPVEC